MYKFLLTLAVGVCMGYIFYKLKIPGGMMVGSIVAVSILNITTGMAYMPTFGKTMAQIIAGAFIGVGIERSDLERLKLIFKPAITLLTGMLILNIVSGFLIYFTSPMDLITSLMCAIPGGISDIPIIADEMGADSSKVAAMQFIRLVFGIGIFPTMIEKLSKSKFFKDDEELEVYKRAATSSNSFKNFSVTILVATVFGALGKLCDIPSAALVFSMVSIIVLKLSTGKASMPRLMRRFAQALSGAYIGSSIEYSEIVEMRYLFIPAILLILGYLITCIFLGSLLHKKYRMPIDESMLASTPAGAADMALISADIGIESADLIVLQIIRMITVVSIFPQLIRLIVSIAE
jgi:hypothetical protein